MASKTVKLQPVNGQPQPDWSHECADNVNLSVAGNILTITVDLSLTRGMSSTGKTQVVASTRGFVDLPTHQGTTVALNVNRKRS